jgi:PMP-22/EMP/MP20/Claudin tight junction
MLTACLLASGAMGLWHTVEFFEKEKVVGDEYFQQWPNVRPSTNNIGGGH